MNTRAERRRGHPFILAGALFLTGAVFLTIANAVPGATTGIGTGTHRMRGALERPLRGEPLDVLFVLPGQSGRQAFLVRFSTAPGDKRVVVYALVGARVTEFLENCLEFPSILRDKGRLALAGWVSDRLRVPVHHIVSVKEPCWPQLNWKGQADTNPLLELSAAYPGRLTASLPPHQNISIGLLGGSLETDPGLSFRQVLGLLGDIETARENVELCIVPFDGSGRPDAIPVSGGVTGAESPLSGLFSERKRTADSGSPPGKFARNCLVTFEPDNIRGKLPPAQLGQVLYRGNPTLKRVALTIDDGWSADMRILDLLQGWKIKYTAFIPGRLIDNDTPPGLAQRVYESGGEICSHSHTHRVMRGLPEPVFLDELWRSEGAICRVTHEVYPYVRFTGGAYDFPSVAWSAREGFWVVNWTIDSMDTRKGVSADTQVNYILSRLEPGAILLCHFGGYHTYEVLCRVIPEIQKRGYEVTSLSRVLEGTPFQLEGAVQTGTPR